jgi:hypothetical protein
MKNGGINIRDAINLIGNLPNEKQAGEDNSDDVPMRYLTDNKMYRNSDLTNSALGWHEWNR